MSLQKSLILGLYWRCRQRRSHRTVPHNPLYGKE